MSSANELEARKKLLKDMKRTKGVRFNASKRLENAEKRATRSIAYASAAVIVVTLLPEFFEMNLVLEKVVVLMTVGLSIFILATSLLHSADSRQVKAEQFQRCALEVNSLRRELIAAPEGVDLSEYATRYDAILKIYNINHDEVDYDTYRLAHPEEFREIAKEDVELARRNVKHAQKASEIAGQLIGIGTAAVLVAVFLSGEAIPSVLEVVASFINSLTGAAN